MAFTATEAYTTGPIAGTEGMDASLVVHFTIENVSNYEYVLRELFPIYFTIAGYDPDYGLVTEMDYGAVLQPGEVYEGVLSRDFSTADDIQGGVVGFNLFPNGGLPEEGQMAPAVIKKETYVYKSHLNH